MDVKKEIKLAFAKKLLDQIEIYNKKHGKSSLRKLALRSELEYSHVQRISKGMVDVSLTTIFAISKGLEINPKELIDFKV